MYSRSGTIRRQRKRKREDTSMNTVYGMRLSVAASSNTTAPTVENTNLQSHLTNDIEVTRGLLCGLDASHDTSLGALTSLSEACAAVWHNAIEFDSTSKGFFLFEAEAEAWVESKIRAHARKSVSKR